MNKTYYKDSDLKIDDTCITFNNGINCQIIPIKSISCIEIVGKKVNGWIGVILFIIGLTLSIILKEETFWYCIPGVLIIVYHIIESSKRSIYIYSHSRNYIAINVGYKNVKDGAYPIITALSKAIKGEDVKNVKDETINKE